MLAVGPGARNDKGDVVPMDVAVGDEIIFSKYGGTEIKLGADEVLILRESDVLAKVAGDRHEAFQEEGDGRRVCLTHGLNGGD